MGFPSKWLAIGLELFRIKFLLHTAIALTVEKKELFIILPHFGNLSLVIKTRLQNNINKNVPLSHIKFKIIFDDQYGTFAK